MSAVWQADQPPALTSMSDGRPRLGRNGTTYARKEQRSDWSTGKRQSERRPISVVRSDQSVAAKVTAPQWIGSVSLRLDRIGSGPEARLELPPQFAA